MLFQAETRAPSPLISAAPAPLRQELSVSPSPRAAQHWLKAGAAAHR